MVKRRTNKHACGGFNTSHVHGIQIDNNHTQALEGDHTIIQNELAQL